MNEAHSLGACFQGESQVYSEMDSMGKALEDTQNRLTELQDQSSRKDAAAAQFMMQVGSLFFFLSFFFFSQLLFGPLAHINHEFVLPFHARIQNLEAKQREALYLREKEVLEGRMEGFEKLCQKLADEKKSLEALGKTREREVVSFLPPSSVFLARPHICFCPLLRLTVQSAVQAELNASRGIFDRNSREASMRVQEAEDLRRKLESLYEKVDKV